MARLKISISLENFKILNFFNLWALRDPLQNPQSKSTPSSRRNMLPIIGVADVNLPVATTDFKHLEVISRLTIPLGALKKGTELRLDRESPKR